VRKGLVLAVAAIAATVLARAQPASAATPITWCGTTPTDSERYPDVAGAQIHVFYVIPSDGVDRFGTLASPIASDLAAIDSWWRRQDPTRALRFDLYAFPGCTTELGRLDLTSVRLRRPAAAYDLPTIDQASDAIYADLRASPALPDPHKFKMYLVYYDGPARGLTDACAVSFRGGETTIAFMYLQPPEDGCPPIDPGAGAYSAMVVAHELVHNLGAVPRGAPHACPGNEGHICDDEADIIYGTPIFKPLDERILDVRHDDYYAHSGSWFDLQDSMFLFHVGAPQYELTVTSGAGGIVSSNLPGIWCPGVCKIAYDAGTKVSLTARPEAGKALSAWSGDCRGRIACVVTMDRARAVTGTFGAARTGGGGGTGGTTRNQAPYAAIVRPGRYTFEARETVTLSSRSYDRDGKIATSVWNWGDGAKSSGGTVSHYYRKDGRYTVSLTVTDDKGVERTARVTITIRTMPPRAIALYALPHVRVPTMLRYLAFDNASLTRVRVEVRSGKTRLLRRTFRYSGTRSASGSVTWKPRRGGDVMWCVRAWDAVGNVSPLDCKQMRVR
jgi:hypothetical protein